MSRNNWNDGGQKPERSSPARRDAQVDQILHDAEHAKSGAYFARQIGHTGPAVEMADKSLRLLKEAESLDPKHEAPAWQEHKEWENRHAHV
jgi:hypothetical protein